MRSEGVPEDILARAINQFNPDPARGSFRGWISTIARNLIVEFLRTRQRRPLTADDSAIGQLIEDAAAQDETKWYQAEHRRQVFAWAAEKLRDSFQPKTWQAFWDTAVNHDRVPEVARRLEMTPGAVYIARSRVMARLREKVQSQLDEPFMDDREGAHRSLESPGDRS